MEEYVENPTAESHIAIAQLRTKGNHVKFIKVSIFFRIDLSYKTSKDVKETLAIWTSRSFLHLIGSCTRGKRACENENGISENCCNNPDCDLDLIKSRPWDENLGIIPECYNRCDDEICYNTSKKTMIKYILNIEQIDLIVESKYRLYIDL